MKVGEGRRWGNGEERGRNEGQDREGRDFGGGRKVVGLRATFGVGGGWERGWGGWGEEGVRRGEGEGGSVKRGRERQVECSNKVNDVQVRG